MVGEEEFEERCEDAAGCVEGEVSEEESGERGFWKGGRLWGMGRGFGTSRADMARVMRGGGEESGEKAGTDGHWEGMMCLRD